MQTLTSISVLLPAYKGSAIIKATLVSLLQQTHKDFEIIIADDGSTQETAELIQYVKKNNFKNILMKP